MMPYTPMSGFPVKDTRTVTDDRLQEEQKPQGATRQSNVYVSTADGDVQTLVVDPSFDGSEKAGIQKEHRREASWQGIRATEIGKSAPPERTHPSPEMDEKPASHARNLSAHFFDAATIKDSTSEMTAPGVSFDDQSQRGGYPTQHSSSASSAMTRQSPASGVPPVSPSAGQKHSRAYSGDMSNPVHAHRRINSIGSGTSYYGSYPHAQQYAPITRGRHHREGSAGLEMLSAAVQAAYVPKEDMVKAAGVPTSPILNPGAPSPAEAHREDDRSPIESATAMRTSPTGMGSGLYVYQQGGSMGAPQFRPPQSTQPGYQQGASYPPQAAYYHPGQSFYAHGAPPPYGDPQGFHVRQMSQSQPMGYPVQYAPPSGLPSQYGKAQFAPPPPPHMAASSSSVGPGMNHCTESSEKTETEEQHVANRNMPYPAAPAHWGGPPRPGTSTGVQTFVTTMAVDDGNKTMRAAATHRTAGTNTDPSSNHQQHSIPSTVGHHRKLSSFSSLSTIFQEGDQDAHHRHGSSYFHNPTDQHSRPSGPLPTSSGPLAGSHHRQTSSSLSFLNTLDERTVHGHHRSTSSSVSFLQALDNLDPNEVMYSTSPLDGQQNPLLGPNTANTSPGQRGSYPVGLQYGGPPRPVDHPSSATCVPIMQQASAPARPPVNADNNKSSDLLAAGGTSKRVRRKCTFEGCPNRVVQGGLCISHGARRKQCKHPGCTKNVKKAGLCSTHGPARKRCDEAGCQKVAVQGGRCIAHGAKKKLCEVDGCTKQAILSGMCKKHHDQNAGAQSRGSDSRDPSPPLSSAAPQPAAANPPQGKRPSHTRGLSIFQEVSPENIQTILSESGSQDQSALGRQSDAFGRM